MKVASIESLLEHELKDLYNAESQLVKALPKMAKAASNTDLQEAITAHLEETQGQVERLEKIGQILDIKLTGVKCKAMEGLLEEGKEILEMEGPPEVIDVAIIASAQRVEHYEISGYGTARALAEHLGHNDVVQLLSETLDEESAADEKLTTICLDSILGSSSDADIEEEEDMDEEKPGKARMMKSKI